MSMDYVRLFNDFQKNISKFTFTDYESKLRSLGIKRNVKSLSDDEIKWIKHYLKLYCSDRTLEVLNLYYSRNITKQDASKELGLSYSSLQRHFDSAFRAIKYSIDFGSFTSVFTTVEERLYLKDYSGIDIIELVNTKNKRGLMNALRRAGVHNLDDFLSQSYESLVSKRSISKESILSIYKRLGELGLHLNIDSDIPVVKGNYIDELSRTKSEREAVYVLCKVLRTHGEYGLVNKFNKMYRGDL